MTVLQEKACISGGGSPISLAFASAITAGSGIHAYSMNLTTTGSATTFSDNNGNTYPGAGAGQRQTVDTAGGATGAHTWVANANAGATTVSASFTNPVGTGIGIREIANGKTYDNDTGVFTASTTTPSTTLSTTGAGAVDISAVCFDTNANQTPTAGAGYTLGATGQYVGGASEFQHFASSGTKTVNFGLGAASQVLIFAVAFDEPTAAAPITFNDDFGDQMDVIGGADTAFGDADSALILMTADSAPVGPAQPDPPVQDDAMLVEWWQDYEDPTVDTAEWSGPVQPQAPPGLVEDAWPWDDFEGDDWDLYTSDSQPVVANVAPIVPNPLEETWFEDDSTDELVVEDSAPVGPNQPPLPVEDAWDWLPEDYTDEAPDDDGANVRNANAPQPAEDAWDWAEPNDHADDPPDDDGWNVRNANLVLQPAGCPEDGWDWSEANDYSDEPPDDDGSNVQNPNQLPIRVQAVMAGVYRNVYYNVGDVFDVALIDFSDFTVNYAPIGADPVFGWMKQVPSTYPLFQFSLGEGEGWSSDRNIVRRWVY